MSGICAIVNFDGAPVDREVLRRMTEVVSYRGPDGIHYLVEGNVGLAHLALHATPEAVRERQPLT
ncbi:MAG: asparagine synthetase B, partial [Armatimonadota bacterium]|nr:asparagine synthetase B [Armatimonadota bacterium]